MGKFRKFIIALLVVITAGALNSQSTSNDVSNTTSADTLFAGFRASRVLSSFPDQQFPFAEYWVRVGNRMSEKFAGAVPASIWIVSLYNADGTTEMNFPSAGHDYDNVIFSDEDFNETYLDSFDAAGLKVYLQIEPGNANADTLINLVLDRYKHHNCVIGFGIDVEYFRKSENPNASNFQGTKVNNQQAQRWEQIVKSHNPEYKLFLKHFFPEWMPPDYRGDIIFADDSQEFESLDLMVDEFKVWGETFSPNPVWYQYGYESDEHWWSSLNDPPKEIGDVLLNSIPNTAGLFWVDFTVTKVFPTAVFRNEFAPGEFRLLQNYPNPFNPVTNFEFRISNFGLVKLKVYDVLGKEIATLIDEEKAAGSYEVRFDASGLSSGVYYYRIIAGNYFETKKMVLIR